MVKFNALSLKVVVKMIANGVVYISLHLKNSYAEYKSAKASSTLLKEKVNPVSNIF